MKISSIDTGAERNSARSQWTNAQLNNYVALLSNNVNGAQHVNVKAIYKKIMQLYRTSVYKNTAQ